MSNEISKTNNSQLVNRIGELLTVARQHTVQTVNTILVKTYWEIGREIVEHELGGKTRAEYGKESLKTLSKELTVRFGKGFSQKNLENMRRFYLSYQISQTLFTKSDKKEIRSTPSIKFKTDEILSTSSSQLKPVLTEKMLSKLSWSHICLLLAVSDTDARSFYEIEIASNGWSVRESKRQIESMLFERLALSKDKKDSKHYLKKVKLLKRRMMH